MDFNFLTKIFGSRNDRLLKQYRSTVARINAKTVTVKDCNDGSRGWRVSPGMLTLATARA